MSALALFTHWAVGESIEMSKQGRSSRSIATQQDREELNRSRQQYENERLTRAAKQEGYEMYSQWQDGHLILIPKPRVFFIVVHDEKTAITNEEYNRIRQEEFNKLKAR
jgi:hypothetical protein